MNKQTEALKMAIEALSQDEGWFEPEAAIKACKDALAQPASKNIRDSFNKMLEDKVAYYKGKQPAQEYLTRAQQVIRANNSAQEPVAWNEEEFNAIAYAYRTCPAHEIKMVSDRYQELVNYVLSITHPAPSWQGLSDDEIFELHHKWIINSGNKDTQYDFARAIEQALKEKNS